MIQYLKCDNGFKEIENWESKCWINVTNPTKDDMSELVSHFNTPDYFLKIYQILMRDLDLIEMMDGF